MFSRRLEELGLSPVAVLRHAELPISLFEQERILLTTEEMFALYRAIYGETGLSRYSVQAVPSIHIIVKNGNVTLEGAVDSEADKNLAGIRANQVPNVFSVKNNLIISS